MVRAVRDCLVKGWEPLVDAVDLPDPDDRHVVAAAIRARAQLIVTANLRDFPAKQLAQWDIEPRLPDDFVLDQIDLNGNAVQAAVQQIADSWVRPPGTVQDVLTTLERGGLIRSMAALRGQRSWRATVKAIITRRSSQRCGSTETSVAELHRWARGIGVETGQNFDQ